MNRDHATIPPDDEGKKIHELTNKGSHVASDAFYQMNTSRSK